MNNTLNLQSSWWEVKEKLKENNIDLTDEDLEYEPGKENQLLQRLQKKMNKSPEEIKAYIESIDVNTGLAG
jgi:uncharacterized protein YjbJ (UPF0337 family)